MKKAFTLVELIVVITILAILWTIAFLSFQGYSKNSRDSVRLNDIWKIDLSLELFITVGSNYPEPSNSFDVMYYDWLAWTQWSIWDSLITNLKSLDVKPLDPLYNNEYTYSVTKKRNEYQIWYLVESNDFWSFSSNEVYADSWKKSKLSWNYNWRFLWVDTSTWSYLLAVPSIISSLKWETDLLDILSNEAFVYYWQENVASSYTNTSLTFSWWFDYNPVDFVLYSWGLDKDMDINDIVIMLDRMHENYDNTPISEYLWWDTAYDESFYGITKILTNKYSFKKFDWKLPKTCREIFFLENYSWFEEWNYILDSDWDWPKEPYSAYCMLDANNEIFTLLPITWTEALHSTEMEAICEDKWLQLYVPRTKEHLDESIEKYGREYFRMMWIYPLVKWQTCIYKKMRYVWFDYPEDYEDCKVFLPKDKWRYYVAESLTFSEPNGDNDIDWSLWYFYSWNALSSYNDIVNSNTNWSYIFWWTNINTSLWWYKNNSFVCSWKDESIEMYLNDIEPLVPEEIIVLNESETSLETSCRQIKYNSKSLWDGYYRINPGTWEIVVYCDMTSSWEAWTLYSVTQANSLHSTEMESICNWVWLQLFVPRTKEHFDAWRNKFSFLYFRLMWIYPTVKWNTCLSSNHMYFNWDINTATSDMCTWWQPFDWWRYFVENNLSVTEPNWDNDIDWSMWYDYNTSWNLTRYNDVVNTNLRTYWWLNENTSINWYKTNRFICSHPDEKDPY